MTPMEIEMLLCVYGSKTPEANVPSQSWNSPAGRLFQQRMVALGLAELDGNEWVATEKLNKYIDHLCSQPLPVQTWIIPTEPSDD
mgnify:CR=1 FL=1